MVGNFSFNAGSSAPCACSRERHTGSKGRERRFPYCRETKLLACRETEPRQSIRWLSSVYQYIPTISLVKYRGYDMGISGIDDIDIGC